MSSVDLSSTALSPVVPPEGPLVDPFGRAISYLRVSVTDRCDFRCVYCMSEDMNFLPKQDLLTLEELDRLCSAFVGKGVRKLRITGGEPLVRRDIMTLFRVAVPSPRDRRAGGADADHQRLPARALCRDLAACGVKRINVSLDTLDRHKFKAITRWGDLGKVIAGIDAAQAAGLAVKINAVALKGVNEDELERTGRVGARARHGPHLHRGDAARRHRARSGSTSIWPLSHTARAPCRHLHPGRHRLTGPAARRAMSGCARPAGASASSRR